MWVEDNYIDKSLLSKTENILIRYRCTLCGTENLVDLYGFDIEFFAQRQGYNWKTNVKCPYCEGACYHDISISSNDGKILNIEVDLEGSGEYIDEYWDSLEFHFDSVKVSYDITDKVDSELFIEIPLELDLLIGILGNDFYYNYQSASKDLKKIVNDPVHSSNDVIIKMCFANAISILETYLSDLAINYVNDSRIYLKRILEEYKIFGNQKIELSQILPTHENLLNLINREIQKMSFHNISIIRPLYQKVFNIDIVNHLNGIPNAISIRHDIIHRNGKDNNGNIHQLKPDSVITLLTWTDELVEYINSKLIN